jgi:structural maintenance of chromosome 1
VTLQITARHIAYELDTKVKHNVVSLDGTYYRKEGVVSSGKASLQEKAKCWMPEEILHAKNRKVDLREKLQDLQKQSRMVPGAAKISDEICSLEVHLKYAKKDKTKVEDKFPELQLQLQEMNTMCAAVDSVVADLQQKVPDHCNKIHTIKNEINIVDDGIFADFCHKIGVTSIREYEGISYTLYKEIAEKRNELSLHKQNIVMQREYEQEKQRSSTGILRKEREVSELKARLETAKCNMQKAEEEKTSHTQKYKDLDLHLQKLKKTFFSAEKERVKTEDDVKKLTEKIERDSLQLISMRLKIKDLKYAHHNLLVQCKVHGLNVPVEEGTMADIHESQSSLNEGCSMSQAAEQGERRVLVDYSQLSDSLKEASDTEQAVQELHSKIEDIMCKIRSKTPNMKVVEEYDSIQLSLREVFSETASAVKILSHDRKRFKQIREDRTRRFMECFSFLETEVDSVYKDLCDNLTGEATLTLENPDEPYLAGVKYSVRVPCKKCVAMDCLSGGEAAIASLAFLFALVRYKKMPFVILDEPDVSLDHRNVARFTNFLKLKNDLQIIVITHSLRCNYAALADDVIGVARENENGSSVSNLSLLDLKEYRRA